MSTNSAPGFKKHPEHRIETKPAGVRVQVTLNGEVIADSRDAVRLEEGDYPPVFNFPRKDVRMDGWRAPVTRPTVRSRALRRTTP